MVDAAAIAEFEGAKIVYEGLTRDQNFEERISLISNHLTIQNSPTPTQYPKKTVQMCNFRPCFTSSSSPQTPIERHTTCRQKQQRVCLSDILLTGF